MLEVRQKKKKKKGLSQNNQMARNKVCASNFLFWPVFDWVSKSHWVAKDAE